MKIVRTVVWVLLLVALLVFSALNWKPVEVKVWESDGQLSLLELLKADPEVSAALPAAELEEKFDLGYHFKQVDRIFARVFG